MPKKATSRKTIDFGQVLTEAGEMAAKQDGFRSFAELARAVLRDHLTRRNEAKTVGKEAPR